ncbi:MAG: sulfatase [Deltaproteobacteria bacterium]|nr:sulfatase [Deltaproteobacteria bacterium]
MILRQWLGSGARAVGLGILGVMLAAGCSPEPPGKAEKRSKKQEKNGEAALVDWAPVPRALLANDAAELARALGQLSPALASRGTAPDIAVIVLDTVRADHLGMYGYGRDTSPRLDAWAEGARVYTRAYADGPWTLPSHASMFTGLPARLHAARSLDLGDPRKGAPLDLAFETVPERLRAAGYATIGIAGNRAFLDPAYQLDQGFDVWLCNNLEQDTRGVAYTAADRVAPLARAVGVREERPTFLFLNFMDAHTPYKARRGYVKDPAKLVKKVIPGNKGFRKVATALMRGKPIDPGYIATWVEAYDSELRFLDEHVGALLAALGEFEYVFVLADHGEYLGEHALVEHAKDVYEPVIHVPFLAKGPGYPPGRDERMIQTHDLAWMVLEAAGLPVPAEMERTAELAVSELHYTLKKDLGNADYGDRFNRVRRAYVSGAHKLIAGSDGHEERYDLALDPGEDRPSASLPALFDGLDARWTAARPERPVVPANGSPAEPPDEQLRALGYVE